MTDLTGPLPPPTSPTDRYYTSTELADLLHTTVQAVRVREHRGQNPPSVKIGRRRLYPHDTTHEWIANQ